MSVGTDLEKESKNRREYHGNNLSGMQENLLSFTRTHLQIQNEESVFVALFEGMRESKTNQAFVMLGIKIF